MKKSRVGTDGTIGRSGCVGGSRPHGEERKRSVKASKRSL